MAEASGGQQRRRVDASRTTLFAVLAGVLGWLGNTTMAFVTQWSGQRSWLAVPVGMVLVGVVTALTTAKVETYYPAPPPGPEHPPDPETQQPPAEETHSRFALSLVAVALLVGAAGVVLTFGVRYVVGWVTGDEAGVDRLVAEATTSDRGLTLTVEEVVQTRHYTRVKVLTENDVDHTVMLSLFNNATLVSGSGTVIEADPFRSDWADSITPGVTQRGVIVFSGHLPDEARVARLTFATVFGQGFEGPESITVPDLRLRSS